MSATYKAAQSACEMFPEKQVTVIDSLTVSMGQGFMAIAAAEAAGSGASRQEIIALVDSIRERLHIYGALNTLKYLALSGRVGKLAAGMANTLDIKPILTARNGKLEMLEKVRTQNKSLKRVVDLTCKSVADRPVEKLAIIHVNNPEGAQKAETDAGRILPLPGIHPDRRVHPRPFRAYRCGSGCGNRTDCGVNGTDNRQQKQQPVFQ